MFPERDLADAFWCFVRRRAMDVSHEDFTTKGGSRTLNGFEGRRAFLRNALDEDKELFDEDPGEPWYYPTLQDALIAFLVQLVSTSRFTYTYEMWLRLHVLVMTDVHRHPDRLTVTGLAVRDGRLAPENERRTHTMIVADEWPSLSRETFDHIVRTYSGDDPDEDGFVPFS